jgi:TolB-like protein/Flp pilus assembly protein TadD
MSQESLESAGGESPTDRPPAAAVDNSIPVFVSYASQDVALADTIVNELERHGVSCWIAPRNVTPGEFYADSIVRALNAARVFVLLLTEHSASSQHVLREIERASSKRHAIVTVRIGSVGLPPAFEYFLSASHWLDASASDINGALPKLVEAVRRLLAPKHAEPGRIETETNPSAGSLGTRARRRLIRPAVAATAVVAVIAASVGGYKWWQSEHVGAERAPSAAASSAAPVVTPVTEKSVAVLPFADMSEKKDQEYFSDGLSEELIDMLTKIPNLRVPARTSSFSFKGTSENIPSIARQLRVAHVLEGSVRKSGQNLRVTAQLIRADTGYHLWSQSFDSKVDDIFKVQDQIAEAVVHALKASLEDRVALRVTSTRNAEAYALYLQGRAMNRSAASKAELENAAARLRKAVEVDPDFTEAWAWLAFVCANQILASLVPSNGPVAEELRHAVGRALELDPNSSVAHGAKATVDWAIDWNWEVGLAEFQKSYELDPTDADNANTLANALLTLHGMTDQVRALFEKAIELDPVNPSGFTNMSSYYLAKGQFAEAEEAWRKAIEVMPTFPYRYGGLGSVLLLGGKPEAALAEFQREPDESFRRWGHAMAYFALGRKSEADAALAEMERMDLDGRASIVAEVYAYRGEIDRAFALLERGYRQREIGLLGANNDLYLKNLHRDKRWKAFLSKLRLPEIA